MEDNLNPLQTLEPSAPVTSPKRASKKTLIIWILVIIAIWALGVVAYEWWQIQQLQDSNKTLANDKHYLESQIIKLKSSASSERTDTVCTDMPTDTFKNNIKAALNTKNTAAFATYTSNPVKFVIAASEKGGNETPTQAAESLKYTNSATGPWDFNLPSATIDNYDAGFYTDYFDANTYVGRSVDGMVIAFDFNCDGKISQIFIAANEDLL